MTQILNLTQHDATPDQIAAGVVEPADKAEIRKVITFDDLPSREHLLATADLLAGLAERMEMSAAMIGGAPFFMGPLERALRARGIVPLYAFSKREASIYTHRPDGSVGKTQVFRHVGFVEAAN